MIKILKLSDRIKLKIDKVIFYLAPLSNLQKMEVSSCTKIKGGEDVFDYGTAQHLYIKHSLKRIEGIESYHGEKYELEFDGESLSDDCVTEIFNLSQKDELMNAAWQILNGMPNEITNLDNKNYKRAALEILKALPVKE